jgi:Tfp pilus assembly protein PilE
LNLLALFLLAAILTAVLLPAYRNYTLREHTILAKAVLKDILTRQAAWQKSHPSQRLTSLEDLGYATPAVYVSSDGTVRESANATSIYRVSLIFPAAGAPESCGLALDDPHDGFVLVAEPIQTQRIEIRCARLCVSSSGRQGASGSAGADACWESRHR